MVTKGSVLFVKIAGSFVAMTLTMNMKLGDNAVETIAKDSTDNLLANIPYVPTGRCDQADFTGELWFEKTDATHLALRSLQDAPLTNFPLDMKLVIPGTLTLTWASAGHSIGLDLVDGGLVKAPFKCKPAGKVLWVAA